MPTGQLGLYFTTLVSCPLFISHAWGVFLRFLMSSAIHLKDAYFVNVYLNSAFPLLCACTQPAEWGWIKCAVVMTSSLCFVSLLSFVAELFQIGDTGFSVFTWHLLHEPLQLGFYLYWCIQTAAGLLVSSGSSPYPPHSSFWCNWSFLLFWNAFFTWLWNPCMSFPPYTLLIFFFLPLTSSASSSCSLYIEMLLGSPWPFLFHLYAYTLCDYISYCTVRRQLLAVVSWGRTNERI